ncbi:MAG: AAA family ATPase, partial [Burkholderiaceae bacterium]
TLGQIASHVHISAVLVDYVQRLIDVSRNGQLFAEGLSPRAGLALIAAARAWALMAARDYVLPDDVQAVVPAVCGHRLKPASAAHAKPLQIREAMAQWIRQVAVDK